jgi:hypothetical protein
MTDKAELPKIPEALKAEIEHKLIAAAFEPLAKLDGADVDLPHQKIITALAEAARAARNAEKRELAKVKDCYDWFWLDDSMAVCVAYTAWLIGAHDVEGWSINSHKAYRLASFVSFARVCNALCDAEAALEDDGDSVAFSKAKFVRTLMDAGIASGDD